MNTNRSLRVIIAVFFCWALTAIGLLTLVLRYGEGLAPRTWQVLLLWTFVCIGIFILLRFFAPQADLLLSATALSLSGLSVVFLQRLDLQRVELAAALNTPAPQPMALLQLLWILLGGVGAVLIVRFLSLRSVSRRPMFLGLAAVVLLLMPLLPFGLEINGARLWVRFGEIQFQPGEFGKLFFALFLGVYLSRFDLFAQFSSQRRFGFLVPPMRQFGPALATLLLVAVILIFERDLGTALLLVLLFVAVSTVATARFALTAAAAGLVVIGGWLAANLFDHVGRRFEAWLSPFDSPDDAGYQILQSIFGLSAGGIFGEGLGSGSPNLVPFAASDFILSVIGEEAGYAGLLAILGIFAVLIGRALKVALNCTGPAQQLIAFSLTSLLAIQMFLVAAGVTRVLPLTGLTTPFLSYGGSSMLACWLIVGLLLKLSNENSSLKSPVVPVMDDVTMVLSQKTQSKS